MALKNFFEKISCAADKFFVFVFKKNSALINFFKRKISSAKKINFRRKFFVVCFSFSKKIGSVKLQKKFASKIYALSQPKKNVLVRYIAKELFLYFIVCFAFFFVIFFVNQILLLAETILKKKVELNLVLRLIVYCLPGIISQSSPFATLVGFLMCLGRIVSDNELLIFRASGQRYSLILKSVLMMGFLISIFSFVMNDYFLPVGTLKYNRLFKQIIASNPAIELESKSIKRMNNSTLVIGSVEKNNVSDLVIFDSSAEGENRIIVAENSVVKKSDAPGVLMQLDMENPVMLVIKKIGGKDFDSVFSEKLRLFVFEDSFISSGGGTAPREMTSWDLRKQIQKMQSDEKVTAKRLNAFKLEYNKKFSVPFGSIFFAMLAFPLALIFGKKDGQTLGLIFGIIISVLYWAATIIGQIFGLRGGYNGFWMMWTPNFVIGFLGIVLYLRLRTK
jgi:lipopolysaccharide export system permease protein